MKKIFTVFLLLALMACKGQESVPSGLKNHLILDREGFRSQIYVCAGGKKTQGFGNSTRLSNRPVSVAQALRDKEEHLNKNVRPYIPKGLSMQQQIALESLVYNIGSGNWNKSKLKRIIQKDPSNTAEIIKHWKEWNLVDGKPNAWLIRWRKNELSMYFFGFYSDGQYKWNLHYNK